MTEESTRGDAEGCPVEATLGYPQELPSKDVPAWDDGLNPQLVKFQSHRFADARFTGTGIACGDTVLFAPNPFWPES